MKKVLLISTLAIAASFIGCKSFGKDNATYHPELGVTTQKVVVRPTESTLEVDHNNWVEGVSYKGKTLFGVPFFENRFVVPTLLNKEGYDPYTLDAINDAIVKANADSFHVVKAQAEVYAFPLKQLPLYSTVIVKVKGHPVKFKFLGPVSEAKADEIYARGASRDGLSLDAATPIYPVKQPKPEACCKK